MQRTVKWTTFILLGVALELMTIEFPSLVNFKRMFSLVKAKTSIEHYSMACCTDPKAKGESLSRMSTVLLTLISAVYV